MTTIVTNAVTGVTLEYCHPPKEAVKLAYLQYTKKNWNTWEYAGIDVPITEGEKTVGCGDWIARKKVSK